MKLIFIYGPPATGKLTVAKELKKLTGYKLFHNQLSVDLLNSIFKFGESGYFRLSGKIRKLIFDAAAKENINLIFTFCYAYPDDTKFVRSVVRAIEKHKGKVCFVQLYCDKSSLRKRVKHASRKNFDKIRTKKTLDGALKKWELFTVVPGYNSLSIDNTKLSPKKVANMIKEHYKL